VEDLMIARIGIAVALVSGMFAVLAPAASASCYPEKPSTCHPVIFHCHVTPSVYCHEG
jgi:hypothetical protein